MKFTYKPKRRSTLQLSLPLQFVIIKGAFSRGRLAQWKTVLLVISHFRYGPLFKSALRQEFFHEWQIKMRDPNSSKYVGDLATSTRKFQRLDAVA